MSKKTLVLVAHRAGARFFIREGRALDLVETIDHAKGRKLDRDLETDRPGRTHDSSGTRHAMEPAESAHERVEADFARALADRAGAMRVAHAYDDLVLVAEPKLLGLMHGALDAPTAKTVSRTITKDLAQVPERELAAALER